MQRTILNIKVKIRNARKAGKKIPKIALLIQHQSSNKVQILPQVQREESIILPDPHYIFKDTQSKETTGVH